MRRVTGILAALALLLCLTACSGGDGAPEDAGGSKGAVGDSLGFEAQSSPQEDQGAASEPGEGAASGQPGQNAKLIRRAEVSIQTEVFDQASAALESLVESCGGYFQSARVEGGSLRNQEAARYGEYVIRLPEQRFDAFLSQSGELGYVTRRWESSENVSQAYYDTETLLATKRPKQERLLALLEQADTMDSIIALENALSEVEYELQSLTADLDRYDDLIDYATVSLYLQEVLRITQNPGETAGLLERLGAGLSASGTGLVQGLQNLLVWLSYHLFQTVLALAAAAAGLLLWKKRRRRRKGKHRPSEPES